MAALTNFIVKDNLYFFAENATRRSTLSDAFAKHAA